MNIYTPSREEIDARMAEIQRGIQKKRDWVKDNMARPEDFEALYLEGTDFCFNTLSLPGWLKVAELAGLPFIPAREILDAPIEDFTANVRDGEKHPFEAHDIAMTAALKQGEMVRMENVAPGAIKSCMSRGHDMMSGVTRGFEGRMGVDLFDDRFYETFLDMSEHRVRGYARPIMASRKIDGIFRDEAGAWPTEFRVYVQDGAVVGVSNYYPQVTMSPDAHAAPMLEAVDMARHLVTFMKKHDILCDNPKYAAEGHIRCTLDFFQTEAGEVLLLEGGPEGLIAADPCCFFQNGAPRLKPEHPKELIHGAAFGGDHRIFTLDELVEMVPESEWSRFANRETPSNEVPGV